MLEPKVVQETVADFFKRVAEGSSGALDKAEAEWKGITGFLAEKGKLTQSEAQRVYDDMLVRMRRSRKDIENRVDVGTRWALNRMNIPSKGEVDELTRRVENLSRKISGLKKQVTPQNNA